jgi:hypothetical protein
MPNSNLLLAQIEFMKRVPLLINKAYSLGYALTGGDLRRDRRCTYGSPVSYHYDKLAIDLNLFIWDESKQMWVWQQKTEAHRVLGEWWRDVIGGIWGGDFSSKDGNHYQGHKSPDKWPEIVETGGDEQHTVILSSNSPITIKRG